MIKIFTSFLFCTLCLSLVAQEKSSIEETEFTVDSTLVLSLNSTIKTLYATISGEKGEKRNWKQFKYLFTPDAKLIPSGRDKMGDYKINYISPKDYIKTSGKWLVENGFVEKEISRRVNTFGNIAQVFSTYESYFSKNDTDPFMRGINSIQLFNDGKRWWIVNIFWTQETKENPIPKAYLPD